jgi:hypothetical protein
MICNFRPIELPVTSESRGLNIKVVYFLMRQDTTRNRKHYRTYNIIITKLYKCSENLNSSL